MALGKGLHKINPTFLEDKDRIKKIQLDEIPIMLSEKGEIVCIPREDEVFAAAVIGSSGKGKTLLCNRLVGSLKHQWKANVAIMNDLSEETYRWSKEMNNGTFNRFNMEYLNQVPQASPIIYLFPNTKTLNINKKLIPHSFFLKTVLPFVEILDNLSFYLKGVSPDFELGKSEMYVNDIKEYLSECDSPSQVKDVLEEQLPGADGKSFKAMRIKIKTAFNSLMSEEMLDLTNPECYSVLRHKDFVSNPFSALMKAGLIPSFITSDLINKKYKSEVFAYYTNLIFNNNLVDFPNEKTFLFFDELRTVCERDDDPAAKAIGNVSARGRINNVGLIYSTQFYNKIPNSVKGAKLNYCFAFAHNNSDILREVGSDFDLDRRTKEKIKKLDTFEIVAMTNNKFICYFNDDRYEVTKPLKGKIFFPLADHLKAGKRT